MIHNLGVQQRLLVHILLLFNISFCLSNVIVWSSSSSSSKQSLAIEWCEPILFDVMVHQVLASLLILSRYLYIPIGLAARRDNSKIFHENSKTHHHSTQSSGVHLDPAHLRRNAIAPNLPDHGQLPACRSRLR